MFAIWEGAQTAVENGTTNGDSRTKEEAGSEIVGFFEGESYWGNDVTAAKGPELVELVAWWRRLLQWLVAGLAGASRAVGG